MSFGITSTGFKLKRLDDIEQETTDSLINEFGAQINLSGSSPLGQIKGIYDERISILWEALQAVYDSQYPATAEGVTLDNVVSITGTSRLPATKSTVTARITGDLGTSISIGFTASVTGNSDAKFTNTEAGVVGAGIDEVQDIDFSAVPTSGSFSLRFDGQDTGTINWDDNNTDVQTALNGLSNLSGVVVIGDFTLGFTVTFSSDDGEQDQPLLEVFNNTLDAGGAVTTTVLETTKGYLPFVDLQMAANVSGSVQAPAGSLTVIETPLGGITSVTNLLDAEVGRDLESDSDLKQRRIENLQRIGSATLGGIKNNVLDVEDVVQVGARENVTNAIVAPLPAKSFEVFALGGDEQLIANAIFEAKPAGIETYGTTTKQVIDSEGVSHDISFSRPTEIDIYMIVNITANADPVEGPLYPATGDDDVEQAILDFTEDFLIGQDVIVNQLYTPINTVAGVFGIEILIGTAPTPTLSDNISIAATEIAKFDSTRITVNS